MDEILFESYYGTSLLGEPYLMHHGVKGQKWGRRRYQYENGDLTPEGRRRLGFGFGKSKKSASGNEAGSKGSGKKETSDKSKKKTAKSVNRSVNIGKEYSKFARRQLALGGLGIASAAVLSKSSNQKITRAAGLVGAASGAGMIANGVYSGIKMGSAGPKKKKKNR